METVWVERDANGAIKGVYANKQPGYAEEELPADDPEVVAYRNPPPPPPPPPSPEQEILFDHENRLLTMEGLPPITAEDFVAKIKSG